MLNKDELLLSTSKITRKIRVIGRLFVLLVIFIFVGITYLTLPATAGKIQDKLVLVSLVSPSDKPALLDPTFDSKRVSLGITPTGWSNSDDPSIDLDPPIPYQQILSEMALSGFQGSQMSPKYPKDMKTLKSELELRGLTISEPWVGTEFTVVGKTYDTVQEFKKQIKFMKQIGGNKVVVAEMGGAVHLNPDVDPLVNRPKFTDKQWKNLTNVSPGAACG
jgi:inosose dehydratase